MSGVARQADGVRHVSIFRTLIGFVGLAGLGLIAVIVALNNVIAGAPAGAVKIGPPLSAPGVHAVLGTDTLGRDVMSEMVHALAIAFSDAAIAAAIAIFGGAVLGFAAVRLPFRAGEAIRAATGVVRAVPALVLAIVLVALLSRDFLIVAVGLALWPAIFNRSFDGALRLAQSRHAMYARASGIPNLTLLRRDIVYELRVNFVYAAGRTLASSATVLATLSFLGFGAVAPHRDLGLMIADARADYLVAWWPALFPALALIALVLCARLAAIDDDGEVS